MFKLYIKLAQGLFARSRFLGNEGGWVAAAIMGAAAVGSALLGSKGSKGGGGDYPDPKILPKTINGESKGDMDILFDEEAQANMARLADDLNAWAESDRDFFQNVYNPFQESLMRTNENLLPAIERTAGKSMEQISRNLMSSEPLKRVYETAIHAGARNITDIGQRFMQELDDLPTEEQAVGQAMTNVELQFGKAGQQLKRDLAARGVGVSQASERQLAIEKAKAKAGAAGLAAAGVRAERRSALTEGLGVMSEMQQAGTQQYLGVGSQEQGLMQLGLGTTASQVGGVERAETGTEAMGLQTGLATELGTLERGTRTESSQVEWTQKGVQTPVSFDEEGKRTDPTGIAAAEAAAKKPFDRNAWERQLREQRKKKRNQERRAMDGGEGAPGVGGGGAGGSGGGSGGMCCFVAGTKITTKWGQVNIEDVNVGDTVLSYNLEAEYFSQSVVNELVIKPREAYFTITFKSGKTLNLTDDHPMWTNNGWASIDPSKTEANPWYDRLAVTETISVGSLILSDELMYDAVESIEENVGEITTYTLGNVTPDQNFFADGYLASNK